ncbi:putative F-box/LRR-repeat protein At5g54820 [Telopea speciosissima]|uniref:putative F-box/LRR-repeat protein At5g54820 n=1 Tax=Telopea speciosissima TaxID=54955 RepID=UPI001CC4D580|nr:putative F-box/LRR-repeat protein At5g54820 [Telopea speciosissima]
MRKSKKQFADLVDRALLLHESQNFRELKISFHYLDHYDLTTRADQWVRFALTNAPMVEMNFSGCDRNPNPSPDKGLGKLYQLPPCPYPSKLLKVMKSNFCLFKPSEHKSFPYLETVILTEVKLPDTSVQDLIAICPHLEFLHLKRCYLPGELTIHAPQSQLKHLWMDSCIGHTGYSVFQYHINVPSLLHFQFVGRMVDGFSLKNLSKLIDASLEFPQDLLFTNHGEMLCELLEDMDHARALTLSSWCLQALPIVDDLDGLRESLPSPLHNLKHLTLQTGLDNYGLVGLACLLRSSPNLEALSIDIGYSIDMNWDYIDEPEYLDIFDFDGGKFWESQLLLFHCLTHHLKKVVINGFMGRNREIGLVKFLLKGSLILKEMVITHINCLRVTMQFLKLKFNIGRKLLALPRACPYAEIKFS